MIRKIRNWMFKRWLRKNVEKKIARVLGVLVAAGHVKHKKWFNL